MDVYAVTLCHSYVILRPWKVTVSMYFVCDLAASSYRQNGSSYICSDRSHMSRQGNLCYISVRPGGFISTCLLLKRCANSLWGSTPGRAHSSSRLLHKTDCTFGWPPVFLGSCRRHSDRVIWPVSRPAAPRFRRQHSVSSGQCSLAMQSRKRETKEMDVMWFDGEMLTAMALVWVPK